MPSLPPASFKIGGVTYGSMLGVFYTASGLGGLIGPPAAGAIIDATGSYRLPALLATAFGAVGFLLLLGLPQFRSCFRHFLTLLKRPEMFCHRIQSFCGLLLLLTELNHDATVAEPMSFSWEIIDSFSDLTQLDVRHYERGPTGLYDSIHSAVPYDHTDARKRYGILSAKMLKPQAR